MRPKTALLFSLGFIAGCAEEAPRPADAMRPDPAPAASLEELDFRFADPEAPPGTPDAVSVRIYDMGHGQYPVPGMQLTVEVVANTAATFTLGTATAQLAAGERTRVTIDTTPYLRKVLEDD